MTRPRGEASRTFPSRWTLPVPIPVTCLRRHHDRAAHPCNAAFFDFNEVYGAPLQGTFSLTKSSLSLPT